MLGLLHISGLFAAKHLLKSLKPLQMASLLLMTEEARSKLLFQMFIVRAIQITG